MSNYQELNEVYHQYYQKDFPKSTLSKWRKEGRIKSELIPKEQRKGGELYDYDLESFKNAILDNGYAKKIRAYKEKPEDYIGKTNGYLLIKGIVPKEERIDKNYIGTVMYCQCLRCKRPDLVQVRFSYLTPNGNYNQTTCGCGRKERAFLAVTRKDIREEFLKPFEQNFEKFLFLHKIIINNTEKYYSNCPIEEYEEIINYFYFNKQFNKIYDFWEQNKNNEQTYYDWAKPSLDHIIPKSRGGTHELKNLQFLTVFENLAKRDMTWEEWKKFKIKTNTTSNYFIETILKEEGREELANETF